MDSKKTQKRKFNFLDAVILLVVLAVVAFAVYKLLPAENKAAFEMAQMSFTAEEVPEYVADELYIGAPVIDADRSIYLGKVVDIIVEDFVLYGADEQGLMHPTAKPGYKNVTVVTSLAVNPSAYGASLSGVIYSVGHTAAIRAGFAKMNCTVSGIAYDNPDVARALADAIAG